MGAKLNYTRPVIEVDYDNFFGVAEALHAVLTLWHAGQYSETYRLLCRSKFKPGMAWRESDVEIENEFFTDIEAMAENNDIEGLERLFNHVEIILDTKDD